MPTRIEQLSRPKPNLLKFPDRRSVYWLDELPTRSKNSTTAFELTPRLELLTQSKQLSHFTEESRSPEWMVSAAALKACPSERVCSLALPRIPADGWQPERPLLTTLSVAVKTAKPSARIDQLAQPKRAKTLLMYCSVDSSAHAISVPITPSSRILQLASPKQVHAQHSLARPVSWPVPDNVLKAVVSERLQILARPKTRQALFEGYDPYRVSPAARAATASPRLLELSLPLPRKCKGQ
ncbi:sperm microtubule associated protein 2 isoform X2 [Onychostoma macrolepis]|uniref:sperm microtubule associated protein 2 isoform X2 n=1 Tax=Onychostoma macrolepis TaxID=369639 RepID=UPI00272C2508|nr:sperm microtubule associated protein 2 isoform X2 [Onychostoma macrolepis]